MNDLDMSNPYSPVVELLERESCEECKVAVSRNREKGRMLAGMLGICLIINVALGSSFVFKMSDAEEDRAGANWGASLEIWNETNVLCISNTQSRDHHWMQYDYTNGSISLYVDRYLLGTWRMQLELLTKEIVQSCLHNGVDLHQRIYGQKPQLEEVKVEGSGIDENEIRHPIAPICLRESVGDDPSVGPVFGTEMYIDFVVYPELHRVVLLDRKRRKVLVEKIVRRIQILKDEPRYDIFCVDAEALLFKHAADSCCRGLHM